MIIEKLMNMKLNSNMMLCNDIHAFGDICPNAKKSYLRATSAVGDNTDFNSN